MGRVGRMISLLVLLYLAACAGLWAMQGRLLFPAPPGSAPAPPDWITAKTIETEDGETLTVWHYPPAKPDCPTILWFLGNAMRIDDGMARFDRFRDLGIGFYVVAYRGYPGSTGKPGEAGFLLDADAAWADLTGPLGIAPDRVVIQGTSIGSGVAVALAAKERPGALVLEAPYESVLALARRAMPVFPVSLLLRHTFRSDERIGAVTAPILIAHGTEDRTIPIESSRKLFARAGEPKTYHAFEGERSQHAGRGRALFQGGLALPFRDIPCLQGPDMTGNVTTRPAQKRDAAAMCDVINPIIAAGGTTAHRNRFDLERMIAHYIEPPLNSLLCRGGGSGAHHRVPGARMGRSRPRRASRCFPPIGPRSARSWRRAFRRAASVRRSSPRPRWRRGRPGSPSSTRRS